jgi:hypothetical protein
MQKALQRPRTRKKSKDQTKQQGRGCGGDDTACEGARDEAIHASNGQTRRACRGPPRTSARVLRSKEGATRRRHTRVERNARSTSTRSAPVSCVASSTASSIRDARCTVSEWRPASAAVHSVHATTLIDSAVAAGPGLLCGSSTHAIFFVPLFCVAVFLFFNTQQGPKTVRE